MAELQHTCGTATPTTHSSADTGILLHFSVPCPVCRIHPVCTAHLLLLPLCDDSASHCLPIALPLFSTHVRAHAHLFPGYHHDPHVPRRRKNAKVSRGGRSSSSRKLSCPNPFPTTMITRSNLPEGSKFLLEVNAPWGAPIKQVQKISGFFYPFSPQSVCKN